MENGIFIATEDELSECICRRLLNQYAPSLHICNCLRRGGSGYLRSNIRQFCELANNYFVLVLTDLDDRSCPVGVIDDWFYRNRMPDTLLFRIAIREVESWLLADHVGLKALMGNSIKNLPRDPDSLVDPKAALINIARKAKRDVKNHIVPEHGAISSQGVGYNYILGRFAENTWNPDLAKHCSESLSRAISSIKSISGVELL